ncbi:hypothetical protein GWK48_00460 [Metallosphaera tengchongensis]|uniref:Uncharacterized protein n=1 Tax=Metallosphaera tengchongensis TaxID=1532350 RepID=A0A6N0NT89_9CREN|nr:hypothetical protein [Metallosphaera tengchongensis]QKQ99068.1 hypothetical protein GWK48_00460 [Metallosphaera tengchongensis]
MSGTRITNKGALSLFTTTFMLSAILTDKLTTLLYLVPLAILNAFTIERLYPKLISWKFETKDYLLAGANVIPYAFLFNVFLLLPLAFLVSAYVLSYFRFRMAPVLLGTYAVSSFYLPWTDMLASVNFGVYSIFLTWMLYTLTQSLLVEYKAPFRKNVKSNHVTVSWIISLIALIPLSSIFLPTLLLGLIEPTIRFLRPGSKLSSGKEMRSLGRELSKRTMILVSVLVISEILIRFNLVHVL